VYFVMCSGMSSVLCELSHEPQRVVFSVNGWMSCVSLFVMNAIAFVQLFACTLLVSVQCNSLVFLYFRDEHYCLRFEISVYARAPLILNHGGMM
jgi:hypothetical protein